MILHSSVNITGAFISCIDRDLKNLVHITVELLYKGHIGTLEIVLYIEVVLNSEVIQYT